MTARLLFLLALVAVSRVGAVAASDSEPTAATIMAKVAENQDRAEKLRKGYVYQQHIRIATRKTNGKLAREETTDYLVAPTPDGVKKEVKRVEGRYWHKGRYIDFHSDAVPETGGLDGSLVQSFRDDLLNSDSKDGLDHDLFPLTSEEQKDYRFEVLGKQTVHDREVYRIGFRPKDKSDIAWAGEALIDSHEFQPMRVFTTLSRRVPLFVRTVLGTDLPGLGFNVEYRRFAEGVWFPVSFGTEFRLRAVFFINRDIIVSLENSDFRHANIESAIQYAEPK